MKPVKSDRLRPLALLKHMELQGESHHDLLCSLREHPDPESRCVLAWRTPTAVSSLALEAATRLEPMDLHRALYLMLDSPRELDRGRGTVTPVARGRWAPRDDGLASFAWTPHAAPMVVRFRDERGAIDARDAAHLARATALERLE